MSSYSPGHPIFSPIIFFFRFLFFSFFLWLPAWPASDCDCSSLKLNCPPVRSHPPLLLPSIPWSQEPKVKVLLRDSTPFFPFSTPRVFFHVSRVWNYCVSQLLSSGSFQHSAREIAYHLYPGKLPGPSLPSYSWPETETINQSQTTSGTESNSRCHKEVLQGVAWSPPFLFVGSSGFFQAMLPWHKMG